MMVTCTECNGSGEVETDINDDGDMVGTSDCALCGGSGEVDDGDDEYNDCA